jgi:hypothetical protein
VGAASTAALPEFASLCVPCAFCGNLVDLFVEQPGQGVTEMMWRILRMSHRSSVDLRVDVLTDRMLLQLHLETCWTVGNVLPPPMFP